MSDPTIPQPRDEAGAAPQDAVEPRSADAAAAPVTPEPLATPQSTPAAQSTEDAAPAQDEPVEDEPVEGPPAEAGPAEAELVEAGPAEAGPAEEPGADVAVTGADATPPPQSPTPQAPPPRGLWTDEQAEALRGRLRDATAKAVDRAAGAVIETVNSMAAAIRSRTSPRRGDGSQR